MLSEDTARIALTRLAFGPDRQTLTDMRRDGRPRNMILTPCRRVTAGGLTTLQRSHFVAQDMMDKGIAREAEIGRTAGG